MIIKVKTLKGEITDLDLSDDATLLNLKERISETKSQPISHINIIFNGAVLSSDDKQLKDYGLNSGLTVVLLIKPPKKLEQKNPEQVQQVQPVHPVHPVQQVQQVQPVNLLDMAHQAAQQAINQPNMPVNQQQTQHQAFQNIIQQNPEEFMQMLMQDPVIQQMANSDPQGFMQFISNPNFLNQVMAAGQNAELDDDFDENGEMYQQYIGQNEQVDLTDAQKQDLQEMVNMGLGPYPIILQYYVAFGYDKVTTVNHLLNEQLDNN